MQEICVKHTHRFGVDLFFVNTDKNFNNLNDNQISDLLEIDFEPEDNEEIDWWIIDWIELEEE